MKSVYILVERPTDKSFLQRVLPAEALQNTEIVVAGKNGTLSLARTLAGTRKRPVVVVLDAHSLNPDFVAERQQGMEEVIRLASGAVPIKVVMVAPEMEAWFFASPETVERLLGQNVPADWFGIGKRDPSGVLKLFAEKNLRTWNTADAIGHLDDEDITAIRALPEVADLIEFLLQMQKAVAV